MQKLLIISFILLSMTTAQAENSCPTQPFKADCKNGHWHITTALPYKFETELEGKSCSIESQKLNFYFFQAFDSEDGGIIFCDYWAKENSAYTVVLNINGHTHVNSGDWSWDYNWHWRCFGNCPIKPL